MCSIIGVGERLHKVLGQIAGEWLLPFGLLVLLHFLKTNFDIQAAIIAELVMIFKHAFFTQI